MSGPQPAPTAGEPEGAGILGNLPRTRPSVRSPRRSEATRKAAAQPGAAKAEQQADEPAPSTEHRSREHDLEELARAGISLAGGAATLGLRVAGRAAAALRGATDRR